MTDSANPHPHFKVDPKDLRRMKILADLSDDQLRRLACWGEPVQFPPNRVIVHLGERGDCMYLILRGEVLVSYPENHREIVLAELETGDFFGDVCLFEEGPRCANVTTKTDCRLLKFPKLTFEVLVDEDPALVARILIAMIRHVAGRLRQMDNRYVDSMLLSRSWQTLPPKQK